MNRRACSETAAGASKMISNLGIIFSSWRQTGFSISQTDPRVILLCSPPLLTSLPLDTFTFKTWLECIDAAGDLGDFFSLQIH